MSEGPFIEVVFLLPADPASRRRILGVLRDAQGGANSYRCSTGVFCEFVSHDWVPVQASKALKNTLDA